MIADIAFREIRVKEVVLRRVEAALAIQVSYRQQRAGEWLASAYENYTGHFDSARTPKWPSRRSDRESTVHVHAFDKVCKCRYGEPDYANFRRDSILSLGSLNVFDLCFMGSVALRRSAMMCGTIRTTATR